MLKQKPRSKPIRSIIKANNPVYVPLTFAVIPGTKPVPGQQPAGKVFGGENHTHVGESPEPGRLFLEQSAQGGNYGGTAVDGKHPDGGNSL